MSFCAFSFCSFCSSSSLYPLFQSPTPTFSFIEPKKDSTPHSIHMPLLDPEAGCPAFAPVVGTVETTSSFGAGFAFTATATPHPCWIKLTNGAISGGRLSLILGKRPTRSAPYKSVKLNMRQERQRSPWHFGDRTGSLRLTSRKGAYRTKNPSWAGHSQYSPRRGCW